MAFDKKPQDPWDRKPEDSKTEHPPETGDAESPAPRKGPLEALRNWNERRKADIEKAFRLPPETCPWCGREMEQGFLQGGRDSIVWSPGWMTFSDMMLGPSEAKGVNICDGDKWRSHKVTWFCRPCKKFVFDLPEDAVPTVLDVDKVQREEDS